MRDEEHLPTHVLIESVFLIHPFGKLFEVGQSQGSGITDLQSNTGHQSIHNCLNVNSVGGFSVCLCDGHDAL